MSPPAPGRLDATIVGGGIAALWLLDALDEAGFAACLLEPGALGQGQTLSSQGIIHGGLKYTLRGLFNQSANAVSAMPARWRDSLAGTRRPNLRAVTVRSPSTWMWRSESLSSQLAMLGARAGLQTRPIEVSVSERPAILAAAPGKVYRVDEPVLDTFSLVQAFRAMHGERMLATGGLDALDIRREADGFRVAFGTGAAAQSLSTRAVILAAGAWNEPLRHTCDLTEGVMQRRPLHMTLLRGSLPELHGHCVDGAATRVTITTSTAADGATIWQVGGQLAERGVELSGESLLQRARTELEESLGLRARDRALDLGAVQWATYRIDRAERATRAASRPEDAQVLCDGPPGLITVWPTKLALAPRAAEAVLDALRQAGIGASGPMTVDGIRPSIGLPPWEGIEWRSLP